MQCQRIRDSCTKHLVDYHTSCQLDIQFCDMSVQPLQFLIGISSEYWLHFRRDICVDE